MKTFGLYAALLFFSIHGFCQGDMVEAKVFEPGVISLPETWDEYITFSPDGTLLAFNRRGPELSHRGPRVYLSEKVNGKWAEPKLASFSNEMFQDRGPAFSPDGNRLYFASNRPSDPESSTPKRRMDIWYSEKTDEGGWGEPIWLGADANSTVDTDAHPALTHTGNLYFVRFGTRETDIYFSRFSNGRYSTPVMMGEEINTEGPDSHPYIDPSERFLIYTPTDREDGYGGGDIYISYKKGDNWTVSKNLGPPVNTEWYEYSAKPGDGNNLYFSRAGFGKPARKPSDIYFVPMQALDIDQ